MDIENYKSFSEMPKWLQEHWKQSLEHGIIIDGECYNVGDEKEKGFFRGFGGDKFTIALNNGMTITTTNLWHKGTVPKFLNLKDNAKFI